MAERLQDLMVQWVKEILLVLCSVLFVTSFVMAGFEVPTGSMEDTVKAGDRILVNKFIYGGSTPYTIPWTSIRIPHLRVPGLRNVQRGDVIVFDWPGERDQIHKPVQTWYLKRCIALAGDTVEIRNREVRVNGRSLENPSYAKFVRRALPGHIARAEIFPKGAPWNEDHYGPVTVPAKGAVLTLNRHNIQSWEVFIRREGHKVEVRGSEVWVDDHPTQTYRVKHDYCFAMGDNRDNSLDSRFWGFVPVEDIVGLPFLVYWSWDQNIPLYRLWEKIRSVEFSRIGTLIR